MNKLPNHTALKEWSNVVAALGRGEQIVLVRKGGIADPSFGVEADRFYLYPTYFHQGESESRPRVAITHWCEVVKTWTVGVPRVPRSSSGSSDFVDSFLSEEPEEPRNSEELHDADVLERLQSVVVLPQETLAARYRFRPDQALYVIAVRTWELASPAQVEFREIYGGCKSWISVDEEIDVDGSRPVLPEAELQAKIDAVDALLRAAA